MKGAAPVAIKLKRPEQIESMRKAGRIVRLVLDRLGEMIRPGVTTEELNAQAEAICRDKGAECLFKGVPGRHGAGPFPGAVCVSLNEQVVHGIPSGRAVVDGDIVSVDFGAKLNGWCADAAVTFLAGKVAENVRRLVDVTRNALAIAVGMARPGEQWSNIARAVQSYVEGEGFSVVREFVGHGIGSEMHEEPQIPNFVSRELIARDIELREGMTLAVEPMVNMGSPAVECAADGWTVRTKDRLPSAHFEETLAVTSAGSAVLTDGR
jgi:methionyl aminopeptidase